MKEHRHSTPGVCPETSEHGENVSIYVDYHHPLLQLKRALPWAALCIDPSAQRPRGVARCRGRP